MHLQPVTASIQLGKQRFLPWASPCADAKNDSVSDAAFRIIPASEKFAHSLACSLVL